MAGSNDRSIAQQAPNGIAQPQAMLPGAYDEYSYQIDTGASQLDNYWDEGLTQFQAPPMGTEFDYSYHSGHQPVAPVTSDLLELKSSTAVASDANITGQSNTAPIDVMSQMYGGYHPMPPADYRPVSSSDPYIGIPPITTFGNAGYTQFCPPASNGINDTAMADHAQFQNGMSPHFGAHYAEMPSSAAMVSQPREKSNGSVSGRYKRRIVKSTRYSPVSRHSPDTESLSNVDRATYRKAQNNARERVRVKDINSAFEELGKLCSQLNPAPTETAPTKMDILNQAYALITQMEEQVRQRKVIAEMKKKAGTHYTSQPDMVKLHDSQDTADVGQLTHN